MYEELCLVTVVCVFLAKPTTPQNRQFMHLLFHTINHPSTQDLCFHHQNRAALRAMSQDHERSATYSRKYNAALWFYDRNQLNECAVCATALVCLNSC